MSWVVLTPSLVRTTRMVPAYLNTLSGCSQAERCAPLLPMPANGSGWLTYLRPHIASMTINGITSQWWSIEQTTGYLFTLMESNAPLRRRPPVSVLYTTAASRFALVIGHITIRRRPAVHSSSRALLTKLESRPQLTPLDASWTTLPVPLHFG